MHVPWKEVHQYVPDALSRLGENNATPKSVVDAPMPIVLAAMEPTFLIPNDIYNEIAADQNSK
jgi:hypothetical protein